MRKITKVKVYSNKNKRKRLSDVFIDLVRIIFATFVIGYFVSPDIIKDVQALIAGLIAYVST
jgi:hypothetical protein